jgi:hypothetical protein
MGNALLVLGVLSALLLLPAAFPPSATDGGDPAERLSPLDGEEGRTCPVESPDSIAKILS